MAYIFTAPPSDFFFSPVSIQAEEMGMEPYKRTAKNRWSFPQGAHHPPSLSPATADWNHLKKKNIPLFPLGKASDIAKPCQLNVKQRSCADLDSPYQRSAELN